MTINNVPHLNEPSASPSGADILHKTGCALLFLILWIKPVRDGKPTRYGSRFGMVGAVLSIIQ